MLNNCSPILAVQKARRNVNKKCKATVISQDDIVGDTIEVTQEEVIQEAVSAVIVKKAKKVSKAGKAVIIERVKALRSRGRTPKRLVRDIRATIRVRPDNTK